MSATSSMIDPLNLNDNVVIVVARFNEDISWLRPIARHCIVYNKGGPVPEPELYKKVVQLDNVGRETHTYLTHILNESLCGMGSMNNMNDSIGVTIFIQGRIIDHIPLHLRGREGKEGKPVDFILRMISETKLTGQSRNASLYSNINMKPSETLKFAGRWNIRDSHLTFGPWFRKFICVRNRNEDEKKDINDKYSFSHLAHLASLSPVANAQDTTSNNSSSPSSPSSSKAPDLSYAPLNEKLLPWYMGAIFGTRNDRIKQHPREYYERLLNQVNDAKDIEEGHYMERSWFYIFNNHNDHYNSNKSSKKNQKRHLL